jgi:superfamily II RNA helicase
MNFRPLREKEYFQLAGRAGRRGIDKVGYAIAVVDRRRDDLDKLIKLQAGDSEPIESQFKLSYNTALHLMAFHNEKEREIILKSNFGFFVKKQAGQQVRIMASFNNKVKKLVQMGHLTDDGKITWKGKVLLRIYSNELLMGEIFATDLYKNFDEVEICLLITTIIYEERKRVHFKMSKKDKYADQILKKVKRNDYVFNNLNKVHLKRLSLLVTSWAQGADFIDLTNYTTMLEGDIVHLFLRAADSIRQIRHSTPDEELRERLSRCLERIYRDIVEVKL